MKLFTKLPLLQVHWEKHYSDVPWMCQRLFVPVDEVILSQSFEFIFEGVTQLPEIDFDWKSDAESFRQDPQIETALASDGMGLVLKLLSFNSTHINGFWIQQHAPIRHANVVCLQQDKTQGDWLVIYNSLDRTKNLQKDTLIIAGGAEYVDIRLWIDLLLNRDVRTAEVMLEADLSLKKIAENQSWIASRFSLEHVLHGLKKTFRYWTEEEKQLYLNDALSVLEALKSLSLNTCVFGGAALGWARNGKFLEHDDDLDVVICLDKKTFPNIAVALDVVTKTLNHAGWEITATFFSHLWVATQSKVAPTLDIFIGLVEEGGISCYPMPRRALKIDQMFPSVPRSLHGLQIPMPLNIEHYLQVDYGPNWQVPSPDYSIEWDRSPYADITGIRKKIPNATLREIAFMRKLAWTS